MDHDTLLTYTDFNENFKINTNASAFHLGAVISQKFNPTAFYSIKITNAQPQYTETDRELLSIVGILEVQYFIGVINFYWGMWPRRSQRLAPLTRLYYIKRKFK